METESNYYIGKMVRRIGTGWISKFCLHNTRFVFNFYLKNECSGSGSGFDSDLMGSLVPDPERQK